MTEIVSPKRSRRFALPSAPGESLELRWAGASDVGRHRAINEDSLVAVPGVIAVADGLGGHSAGDVASTAAVRRLAEWARASRQGAVLDPDDLPDVLVRAADDILLETAGSIHGSGTTVTGIAVIAHEGRPALLAFNIGDSRVYRWRDGVLLQLTVDHSYVQELVDSGQLPAELAEAHPDANIITRALGFGVVPPYDSWVVLPAPGDRYLACTDGLTREVAAPQIARILGAGQSPQEAAAALVAAANDAGGHDNITVAIVDVIAAPAVPTD